MELVAFSRRVSQFQWGVFLGVPTGLARPVLRADLWTEPGARTRMDRALWALRVCAPATAEVGSPGENPCSRECSAERGGVLRSDRVPRGTRDVSQPPKDTASGHTSRARCSGHAQLNGEDTAGSRPRRSETGAPMAEAAEPERRARARSLPLPVRRHRHRHRHRRRRPHRRPHRRPLRRPLRHLGVGVSVGVGVGARHGAENPRATKGVRT